MDLDVLSVRSFFEQAVAAFPDEPFLIWTPDGSVITYAQAEDRIDRAANVWHTLGVRKGDRVAFMADNSPDFLIAWLGLAKIGGVLVAINTGFRAVEASYLVADSEARFALVDPKYLPLFDDVRQRAECLETVLTIGQHEDVPSFTALMDGAEPCAPPVELHGDDLISLIYTSGTTGNPKGVMQTHRNFVLTGQAYGHWMRMSRGQRIYACLPLFHINSQAYSTMGVIGIGGALVLAPRFSAGAFWDDVRKHRVNVFNFIGAMTVILSKKEPAPDDADHDVHIAYGVPALDAKIRGDIERRFGLQVISGFGMSETTFGLLEPLDEERRPGSMGVPRHHPDPSVPRTEARIVDDEGREVGPGVVGELVLRNAAMMSGYFRDPERTAEALVDGWLHTGDSAHRDADGFFFFVDRKKDIIRRRGENVSSLEVERVIERHPGVQEAAVIGVPSELTDEELLTYIVRRPGAEVRAKEIFDWCADNLAAFKVPRYLEFIDALPKTPTSKIQKALLRGTAASPGRVDRTAMV
ncbi:AMP-binding protein [Nonomuraea sp. K274]|uniref:AMP-binding protein n=1 Tax=Nonomuraea cypriaca TaxID=1187855 RepID=A0A931A856_9ACTN|nr:AMP-binding protein [Nonomuraea cypriaca]MBF8184577.1 AMP-binding protein [Nonomuraea cypriaca]